MPLPAGTKLDSYEIVSPIGAGGMGEVYRARDTTLRRDVAIKVLPEYWSRDPDRLRRFEVEAQAAATLNHPNVISIFHVGQYDGSPYIVTELLQGETLRERLRHRAMPLREVLDTGGSIAHGLAAAHVAGVVHRDLKPENIFLTKDGRVKILDFGLAKFDPVASESGSTVTVQQATNPGHVLGTVGYMSPEQVRGNPADTRSDIFALGLILYEMLTGHRAFKKATSAETMAAILNEDPPPLSQLSSATPPALHRVISRCLMKNPEQRFQHASDLAFALEAMSAPSTSASTVLEKAPPSRWAWIALAITFIFVVAILVTMWLLRPAQPVIESVKQLTNDGQPKTGFAVFTDGSRIYFNEGAWRMLKIVQIGIDGGEPATIPTSGIGPGARAILTGLAPKGSALLLKTPEAWTHQIPLWELPLPAGAARPVNGLRVGDTSYTPDGRILYTRQGDLSSLTATAPIRVSSSASLKA
jgi:serine/threonine protein kinase